MSIRTLLALALCVLAAASSTCAPLGAPDRAAPAPTQWRLSPGAAASYYYLVFQDARRKNQPELAMQALDQLLRLDPSPDIYLDGSNFLWREGRTAEARDLLKRGIAAFPDQRELHLTLATTYYAEKRRQDAIATLNDYLSRHPEDHAARQEVAAILLEAKQFPEALDVLEALPHSARTPAVLYYMAKANAGVGKNRQAIALLRSAVQSDPNFLEGWAELAYLQEMDKDYVEAEKTYQHILEMGESGEEVWLRLISLNLKLNNPDKALALYHRAPSDPDFAMEAASRFLDEKFYEQARDILGPLSRSGKAPERIWFSLAVLAFEGERDAKKALEALDKIGEDSPHFEQALRFRIHLLMETGRQAQALALVEDGKRRKPDEPAYWLLESQIRERAKDLAAARTVLEEAHAKWPEDSEVLYALGLVLDKLGLPDEGVAAMEKILSANPEHADALNYVGYTLADRKQDLDRALILIRKALEIKPGSGYIVDSLAWAYFRQGKLGEAWAEIQRAVLLTADDPVIWEHYGDIAKATGRKDKARDGFRKSLKIAPDKDAVRKKLEAL